MSVFWKLEGRLIVGKHGARSSYQVPTSGLSGGAHLVVGGEDDEDLGSHDLP